MQELKKQIRKQKTKVILWAILSWAAAGVLFSWFIYSEEIDRMVSAEQAIKSALPWGICFAAVLLVWLLVMFIVLEVKDDHNKVLAGLTEVEKEKLAHEIDGENLFLLKLTVGNSLVILNANSYTLKLIPIKSITQARMVNLPGAKRRMADTAVMYFHTDSGKEIRSSAIAVTDPVYPIVKIVFDKLSSRVKKSSKKHYATKL